MLQTVANKLLMDYFNSDLKRNYEADATDSDPDEMDSEEEKQMINDAAFEEVGLHVCGGICISP